MAAVNSSIEKLQKRLEKDPNSLQFVQLVEEYRKEGMLEEAMKLCQDGLNRHPNYWSARVALGRIYHMSGEPLKASEELEKVIHVVPDNLLANRLLGDIYHELGQDENALERYRIVQMITPADQEVTTMIEKLEESLQDLSSPTIQVPAAGSTEEVTSEASESTDSGVEELSEEIAPDVESSVETVILEPEEEIAESPEVQYGEEDLAEMANQFLQNQPSEPVVELVNDDLGLDLELPDSELEAREGFLNADEEPEEMEISHPQDRTQPLQEMIGEPIEDADELTSETLAELYLSQGLEEKAARVYQKLLLLDPGNLHIQQKVRELNRETISPVSTPETKPAAIPVSDVGNEVEERKEPPHRSREMETEEVSRISEERKRKINTLESWLHSIGRDRG